MALSKAAGRILEAVLVLGITTLFTYIGFSLIAGIAHGGEDQGGGRIIAGVVLLFGWFATESAINHIFSGSHGSSSISLLTTCMGWLAQFLFYLAVYWLLKRLFLFVQRSRQTAGSKLTPLR